MLSCYGIFFLETSKNSSLPTEAETSCCMSARGARRKIESFDCPGGVFVYLLIP